MKKNIKLVTLFGAICLMTSALTSCKLFGNNGKNDGPNVDENIDLNLDPNYETKISLLIPNGNSNEETMINELIKEFNKDYPNITFEKNYISVSGYENTVRNQWIAGSLPDIVWSNSPDFYTLVGNEMALPLNTFIEKAGINLEEDYMKSYFDAGSVDGKYYCFPRSCDSVVTFINTKLLKQSGIDTSKIKNGWTWSDFTSVLADYRAYLDTTSNKNTYYCLDANLTGWLSVSYPILRSYGGEVIDDNQNILIDSPETRKALEMVKSLVDNKYIVASGLTSGNSYETGTSPFLFQSASISLYAERRALKDSVDIVSFPLIEDNNSPKIGSGIAGYCINSRVKDKKQVACWKFMEKMISYEGQGNGFLINRTKGANYNNQIVKIPANLKVKMGNPYASTNDYLDETITVTEEALYICKLADGEYGAWEKLVNPTSITLDKEDLTLKVNGTSKLTAKVEGTTNGTLFYKSSNTNVATVDEEGNIVAKGKGEATITANCGTIKKSIKVSVTSDEPSVQTGIKIIKGKTIEIYKGENYSLSDLKVVKVYNDNPEGEEVTLTNDMISGTFDNNKAGTYTLTITSGEFSDTFTITVKDAGVIGVKELKNGYNFGNNSGWGDFYLQTDAPNVGTQWLNIKGEAFNNLNKYIKVNGKSGVLSNVKCFHGVRYEFWFDTETKNSLKAGDVITISKDTPFYYYSGTTDGNHEPMGDGTYQARNRLDKEYKFVYTGHDYEVFAGEPTELNVANSSMTLAVGEEIQINYSFGPTGTYGTPTFTGYDDKIISVSKDGKIIGLATGNTQVTLTLGSLTKTINVTVLNAKDIKEFKFTNIPTYFSILKDTKNVDLTSKLKTGKYIFSDNTESGEVQVTSVKMKTNLDTSVIVTKQVEFDVTINSKTYTATVEVQIYEYYDQKPSEVAIVEWFDYAVFLQFPKTMTNAVNITGANDEENALLKETMKNISYTRKDGTEVKLNGGYELATNIAIFPEFMYEQKDEKGNVTHAKIGADNYNSDGYYMAGDMITVLQDTPIYKWTGSKGDQDRPVAGTGEYIIEGYIKEKLVYKFNGSVWTSFIEYTDMVVNTKTLEVTVGKTGTIEAKRIPDNATQGVFSYESSDSSIATVNSYGIVKGLKEGKVTITITLKDEDDPSKTKTGTCEVTVVDGITSIKFDKDSYDVSLGTSVEDLLKKFSGSYVYASGKVGEKVDFTNATIDGYNKDKEGSQNITVTVNKDGKSITSAIKVNVTSKKGCGGDIITTSALISTLALLGVGVMLTITYKKKKENK